MPCVGLSSKSTWASVLSHRAKKTFCWLPPESELILSAEEFALMLSSLPYFSKRSFSRFVLMANERAESTCSDRYMFSSNDMSGITEFSLRSAGSIAMPAPIAS